MVSTVPSGFSKPTHNADPCHAAAKVRCRRAPHVTLCSVFSGTTAGAAALLMPLLLALTAPAPTRAQPDQGPIACGATASGDTSAAGNFDVIDNTANDHFYTFSVPAGGAQLARFSTCTAHGGTATYDTYLRVYGDDGSGRPTGTELAENDDGPGCQGYRSTVDASLQPGSYVLVVEGFSAESGTYTVSYSVTTGLCPGVTASPSASTAAPTAAPTAPTTAPTAAPSPPPTIMSLLETAASQLAASEASSAASGTQVRGVLASSLPGWPFCATSVRTWSASKIK